MANVSWEGKQAWSRWLRRYRDERDLTQEELGEVLGVDGKMVSAWENGQRPARKHTRNICSKLHTTRLELGLTEEETGPVVARRDFLRRSAGWGALAVFGPWAGLDPIDAPAIDGFEATSEMLGRLWMRAGPAAALGPTLGHVEAVTRLLQGSLPSSLRPRLCRVLAETAVVAAVCKGWMGDTAGADHFATLAFEAAREGADPDLAVHVLLMHTSGDRGLHDRPMERLRKYVEGDLGFAVGDAAPVTKAWARAKAADVYASLGQADACLAALEEGSELVVGATSRRYPWPDEAWLTGERGASLARLGRTGEAREALSTALLESGPERAVDRLWLTLATARTHVEDGDSEQAARIAAPVLGAARHLRHGHLEDELRRLHAAMHPPTGPAVMELGEALSSG
jgi:transcriptional regulator with XRE-family HTH domain